MFSSVFSTTADQDPAVAAKLCLVCRTSRSWVLPRLYSTVTLTSSSQILAFTRSLMSSAMQAENCSTPEPTLGSHVRNLWIGPISAVAENDLSYASTAWPVTLIHQTLSFCQELHALAIINFAQHLVYRLEGVIPATVQSIYLGPVHGHLDISKLRCSARLRSVTSMDTYMSDWEVQELVTSPHIECFRRFYSGPARISFAFDQLPCVKKATSLQHMQIICCDESVLCASETLTQFAKAYEENADPRIELIAMTNRRQGRSDGILAFYDDWMMGLGLSPRGGAMSDIKGWRMCLRDG